MSQERTRATEKESKRQEDRVVEERFALSDDRKTNKREGQGVRGRERERKEEERRKERLKLTGQVQKEASPDGRMERKEERTAESSKKKGGVDGNG